MRLTLGCLFGVAAAPAVAPAATFDPITAFGGGDGWRAPAEVLEGDSPDSVEGIFYRYLDDNFGSPNLERGIAYNHTTGNLLLLSRNGDPDVSKGLRILDGVTGVDKGFLDFTKAVVEGGTFTRNMIAVADDGAIFMANLTTDASANPFKIYRWANETATEPTLVYSGAPLAGARMGDTLDAIGSGANTRLVAGYGSNPNVPGNNSFAVFDTDDGVNFTATHVQVTGTPPAAGDFRLGISFVDEDTVIGTQGLEATVRMVDFTGGAGTLVDSFTTDGSSLRPLDFAVVDGRPLMAIQEASPDNVSAIARARIFVYDLSDSSLPLAERKIAEASALPTEGPLAIQQANINGTGQVRFGPIDGRTAIIYGLSTNNGIQAFQLTLDAASIPGDFNGDGVVDGADLATWETAFGTGELDGSDLLVWQQNFGSGAAAVAAAAVPEPTAAALIALAAVGMAAPRRRG